MGWSGEFQTSIRRYLIPGSVAVKAGIVRLTVVRVSCKTLPYYVQESRPSSVGLGAAAGLQRHKGEESGSTSCWTWLVDHARATNAAQRGVNRMIIRIRIPSLPAPVAGEMLRPRGRSAQNLSILPGVSDA